MLTKINQSFRKAKIKIITLGKVLHKTGKIDFVIISLLEVILAKIFKMLAVGQN